MRRMVNPCAPVFVVFRLLWSVVMRESVLLLLLLFGLNSTIRRRGW